MRGYELMYILEPTLDEETTKALVGQIEEFIGNQGARLAMSPTTRLAIKNFWEIAAFIINSLIFLMIGTQIHLPELWSVWPFMCVASSYS